MPSPSAEDLAPRQGAVAGDFEEGLQRQFVAGVKAAAYDFGLRVVAGAYAALDELAAEDPGNAAAYAKAKRRIATIGVNGLEAKAPRSI